MLVMSEIRISKYENIDKRSPAPQRKFRNSSSAAQKLCGIRHSCLPRWHSCHRRRAPLALLCLYAMTYIKMTLRNSLNPFTNPGSSPSMKELVRQ